MTKGLESIKRELARLASHSSMRWAGWTKECPTEWAPEKVIDPRTGSPFTRDGAWDFVVEQLLKPETVIQEKTLSKPPDKTGYVLHVATIHGTIYIKVHFGNGGRIIGRSFHY